MSGRDIHEAHRVATPLELLYDLTFVVAIALTGHQLHHAVVAQHVGTGLLGFAATFMAVWWAWMTFSWFASAYDTDDAIYRLYTMAQMVGVLILAAGVPDAGRGELTIVTIGYVVMRVGMIALWHRVSREHPECRRTALRFAWGSAIAQTLWVARLALPAAWTYPSWATLMVLEFAVPVWATRAGHTPWHAHHIAERYGLFAIIVLGECVLGSTQAVSGVIEANGWSWEVVSVGVGTMALVLALWWVYFLVPFGAALHHRRQRAFAFGYGHFIVFVSLAAMGAFLAVVAEQLKLDREAAVSPTLAIGLLAGAVACYLTVMWAMAVYVAEIRMRSVWVWAAAITVLGAVVGAVALGLPLPWALPLLAIAPAMIVVAVSHAPSEDR